jgi:hypothetical protein
VLGLSACAACVGMHPKPDDPPAPQAFYTVTAEIALARHHPRVAALQYAAAAENDTDVLLLQRASQVAADCLQPTVADRVAARWIKVDPKSVEAHRAAARAALALYKIDQATAHYHFVLLNSPIGTDAELAALETELGAVTMCMAHARSRIVWRHVVSAVLRLAARAGGHCLARGGSGRGGPQLDGGVGASRQERP